MRMLRAFMRSGDVDQNGRWFRGKNPSRISGRSIMNSCLAWGTTFNWAPGQWAIRCSMRAGPQWFPGHRQSIGPGVWCAVTVQRDHLAQRFIEPAQARAAQSEIWKILVSEVASFQTFVDHSSTDFPQMKSLANGIQQSFQARASQPI